MRRNRARHPDATPRGLVNAAGQKIRKTAWRTATGPRTHISCRATPR
jgi:hypothetical protein